MNRRFESHLVWGPHSPLALLTGLGLVILSSSRLAFAITCTGALLWVNSLSALIFSCGRSFLPERGKMAVLLFLTSFLCGLFMFLIGLINPLLVMMTGFLLILIPPYCLGSGFFEASISEYPIEVFSRAVLEALILGALIIAFSLIREPLGMRTLSFPGGPEGLMELFPFGEKETILPVQIMSMSSGGLLLLGYCIALFRYFKERNGSIPRNNDTEEER